MGVTVIPHANSSAELYKVSIINGTETCTMAASDTPLKCMIIELDRDGHEYTVGARSCAGNGSSEVCSTLTIGRMEALLIGMSQVPLIYFERFLFFSL